MGIYKVGSGGKAPKGLRQGDEVVTAGGTYRITGVNPDGTYRSELTNKQQNTYNYRGGYANETYGNISGVSGATAGALARYEQGYQPSESVAQAQAYLQQMQGRKPGAYTSRWDQQLDDIYQKIINREPFQYDLNADMLYQQYKDQYQSLGQMAMMDTMGQSAALTGGYSNTYAQNAGQQAYHGYLQQLNDVVPELYQMAYSRYRDEGTDLYNQFGLVEGMDERDYGRYRDTVSDYYSDMGLAMDYYDTEANRDYQQWATMMDYYTQKAAMENDDYWTRMQYERSQNAGSGGGGSGGSKKEKVEFGPGMSNENHNYDQFKGNIGNYLRVGNYQAAERMLDQYAAQLDQEQWNEVAEIFSYYGYDMTKYK